MNKVITERTFQETMHKLASQSDLVRAAVSYCGRDAIDFFPEHSRPEDIRILVDISDLTVQRGLTNPMGVSRLCQIANVRCIPGLHSKVVIFGDADALVGSINFTRNAIEGQRQCCIHTDVRRTLIELGAWFDDLWDQGDPIKQPDCRRLEKLFPKNSSAWPSRSNRGMPTFKTWRKPLEDFSLEPGDFEIGLTKSEIKKAIHLFRTKQCGYLLDTEDTRTCAQCVRSGESDSRMRSKQFHSLLKKISKWKRQDVEDLFNLAFTHGRAAMIRKPLFLKTPVEKIQRTMAYLFSTDSGDPLIRFEHVVDGKYKLNGMGYSGIAYLMHLWKPEEYSVWNASVDKGLKHLKVHMARGYSSHAAQGYADRIAALRAIMDLTGLKSFHAADHFVDAFGKGHLSLR